MTKQGRGYTEGLHSLATYEFLGKIIVHLKNWVSIVADINSIAAISIGKIKNHFGDPAPTMPPSLSSQQLPLLLTLSRDTVFVRPVKFAQS